MKLIVLSAISLISLSHDIEIPGDLSFILLVIVFQVRLFCQ